ncbi:MAG: restriction endonuclease subunit S [Clostridia bacterium]|nr:restriction endonuclease subunit S [Clostridia bacterium]
MARLGDIASVVTKGTTPTSLGFAFENEGINFIKIESIEEDGSFIKEKFGHISEECDRALSRSRLQENDILFSIAGAIGRTAIVTSEILPANTNQALAIIRIPKGKIDYKFLDYALHSGAIVDQFEKKKQGVAQLNISLADVRSFQIPDISIQEQSRIVAILGKVNRLISLRKQQLQKLDDLVKSRFVELFGDPSTKSLMLPIKPMPEVCEIIDGDRGVNYPKQEDFSENGYCLFLNAKNVTKQGFNFDECLFITKEKDESLRKGKLKRGDVVLTTRGTIGNLAFYTNDIPFEHIRINSGMVLLRMKEEINERFFIEQFKFLLEDIKKTIASGSAQPQLPISTMNKIKLLVPPLEKQEAFSNYISKVDNNHLTIQHGLDKLELLKQSFMQKYFG